MSVLEKIGGVFDGFMGWNRRPLATGLVNNAPVEEDDPYEQDTEVDEKEDAQHYADVLNEHEMTKGPSHDDVVGGILEDLGDSAWLIVRDVSGQWVPIRIDELMARIYGNRTDLGLTLLDHSEQLNSAWVPYIGKRGKKKGQHIGWFNNNTKRVVYGLNRPGDRKRPNSEPSHGDLRRVLGNMTTAQVRQAITDHFKKLGEKSPISYGMPKNVMIDRFMQRFGTSSPKALSGVDPHAFDSKRFFEEELMSSKTPQELEDKLKGMTARKLLGVVSELHDHIGDQRQFPRLATKSQMLQYIRDNVDFGDKGQESAGESPEAEVMPQAEGKPAESPKAEEKLPESPPAEASQEKAPEVAPAPPETEERPAESSKAESPAKAPEVAPAPPGTEERPAESSKAESPAKAPEVLAGEFIAANPKASAEDVAAHLASHGITDPDVQDKALENAVKARKSSKKAPPAASVQKKADTTGAAAPEKKPEAGRVTHQTVLDFMRDHVEKNNNLDVAEKLREHLASLGVRGKEMQDKLIKEAEAEALKASPERAKELGRPVISAHGKIYYPDGRVGGYSKPEEKSAKEEPPPASVEEKLVAEQEKPVAEQEKPVAEQEKEVPAPPVPEASSTGTSSQVPAQGSSNETTPKSAQYSESYVFRNPGMVSQDEWAKNPFVQADARREYEYKGGEVSYGDFGTFYKNWVKNRWYRGVSSAISRGGDDVDPKIVENHPELAQELKVKQEERAFFKNPGNDQIVPDFFRAHVEKNGNVPLDENAIRDHLASMGVRDRFKQNDIIMEASREIRAASPERAKELGKPVVNRYGTIFYPDGRIGGVIPEDIAKKKNESAVEEPRQKVALDQTDPYLAMQQAIQNNPGDHEAAKREVATMFRIGSPEKVDDIYKEAVAQQQHEDLYEGNPYEAPTSPRVARLKREAAEGQATAAQGSAQEAQESPETPQPPQSDTDLENKIIGEFERLKQEKYSKHGMVPIPELRRIVEKKFGKEAASHEVFDKAMKSLRSQYKIRLVGLGDGSNSPEDLEDSIRHENETYGMVESDPDAPEPNAYSSVAKKESLPVPESPESPYSKVREESPKESPVKKENLPTAESPPAHIPPPENERMMVDGDTFPHRDFLRRLGARWDSEAKKWSVTPDQVAKLPHGLLTYMIRQTGLGFGARVKGIVDSYDGEVQDSSFGGKMPVRAELVELSHRGNQGEPLYAVSLTNVGNPKEQSIPYAHLPLEEARAKMGQVKGFIKSNNEDAIQALFRLENPEGKATPEVVKKEDLVRQKNPAPEAVETSEAAPQTSSAPGLSGNEGPVVEPKNKPQESTARSPAASETAGQENVSQGPPKELPPTDDDEEEIENSVGYRGKLTGKSYVAEITGLDPKYGLAREFDRGEDSERYARFHANRKGKGSWKTKHVLKPGRIYEINRYGIKEIVAVMPGVTPGEMGTPVRFDVGANEIKRGLELVGPRSDIGTILREMYRMTVASGKNYGQGITFLDAAKSVKRWLDGDKQSTSLSLKEVGLWLVRMFTKKRS